MSVPVSTTPQRQLIAGIAYNFPNWSNTTPFTYQDGWTAAKMLESLVAYINNVLVPYVDTEVGEQVTRLLDAIKNFDAELKAQMDQLDADLRGDMANLDKRINGQIDDFSAETRAKIDEFNAQVTKRLADNLAAVNAAIDEIINNNVIFQDPLVAKLLSTIGSNTRTALDQIVNIAINEALKPIYAELEKLVVPEATEVVSGKARFSTTGEAFAGNNDSTIVTPKKAKEVIARSSGWGAKNALGYQQAEFEIVSDNWTGPAGQALTIPTHVTPSGGEATHPSILYFPAKWNGYHYWMGYTPYPASNDDHEDPNLAVSNDGVNWSFAPGVTQPLDDATGQPEYNSDIELAMGPDGTMYVIWRFYNPNSVGSEEKLYYRSSTDGKNWGAKTQIWSYKQTDFRPLSPSFTFDEESNKWLCWAIDISAGYTTNKLVKMTSANANIASIYSVEQCSHNIPAGNLPWHAQVRKMGAQWVAIVATSRPGVNGADGGIMVVMNSRDGISWKSQQDSTIPVAVWGKHDTLYRASFIPSIKNGVVGFMVWYSASLNGPPVKWGIFRSWIGPEAVNHFERRSGPVPRIETQTGITQEYTFDRPFKSVPQVVYTTDSGRLTLAIISISKTGFTVRLENWSPRFADNILYTFTASLPVL